MTLTVEQLAEVDRLFGQLGADVSQVLRPGLRLDEIRRLAAEHEVALADEALTWWQWHDGSVGEVRPGDRSFGLEDALAHYRWRRERAEQITAKRDTPSELRNRELWWNRNWLPFINTSGPHVPTIDCNQPDGAPAVVRQIDWELISQDDHAAALYPSLGAWVAELVDALREERFVLAADGQSLHSAESVRSGRGIFGDASRPDSA